MIRLLDANALISLQQMGRSVAAEDRCYVPIDVAEELKSSVEGERWLSEQPLASMRIDEAQYLKEYARFLNTFTGVSFYSLRGFGDVSALAVLQLLVRQAPATANLFPEEVASDAIFFVTDDKKLRDFTHSTFGSAVILETLAEFLSRS